MSEEYGVVCPECGGFHKHRYVCIEDHLDEENKEGYALYENVYTPDLEHLGLTDEKPYKHKVRCAFCKHEWLDKVEPKLRGSTLRGEDDKLNYDF